MGIFDPHILPHSTPICTSQEFSVMGFSDVLYKIPFIIRIKKEMLKAASYADKILLMDSSSFNIPLAKNIKKKGYKGEIIYYILPQVWVWKQWRARILEQYCDKLAAILPFETSYYQSKAQFVGNPLLDELPSLEDIKHGNKEVAFLPGSRATEIRHLFPIFAQVATILRAEGYTTTLIIPHALKDKNIESLYGNIDGFHISFDAISILSRCFFAFICSGTATLQAALLGTPFVLAYRTKPFDYWIARTFINPKYVGLANILCHKMGKNIFHQELLQNDVNIHSLLYAFRNTKRDIFLQTAYDLRNYLQHGSAEIVAKWLTNKN